jgi:hypothetical protein
MGDGVAAKARGHGQAPRGRTIRMGFVLDVVGYGARAAPERIDVERRLPPLIRQTLGACGLSLDSVDHRWTGDGISVMLPTGIDQSVVLPVLIRSLAGALGADNARNADRIRARLGIALGLVEQHANGFAGPLVVDVNRLVGSRPLRSALASHDGADLAVAVSDQLYHAVIRPGYPGIPGGQFSRVNVVEKEFSGPAWVWVSSRQWSGPVYSPLLPGDPRQVSKYRLVARIGRGPAGTVYLGRDTTDLGSAVAPGRDAGWAAVKIFDAALTADADAGRHLAAGALAAGVLRGQNLAHLLDSDAAASPAWAAATFVPGPSLAAAVAETGPLPGGTAAWLALDIARAVATPHAAGLSHGAVTPNNVLLTGDGPVLTDFGVNRAALTGGPGSAEADVFELGCTVFYAATGRSPWGDRHDGVPGSGPDLADCPAVLTAALTACLSADPADRPTAAALVTWLAKVAGARPRFWLPDAVAARLAEYQVLPTAVTPPNGVRFWPRRRHGR